MMGTYTLLDLVVVIILTTLCVVHILNIVLSKNATLPQLSYVSKSKQLNGIIVFFALVQLTVFIGHSETVLDHVLVSFLFLFWPSFYFSFLETKRWDYQNQRYYRTFYMAYVLALLTLLDFFINDLVEDGGTLFFNILVVLLMGVITYYFVLFLIVRSKGNDGGLGVKLLIFSFFVVNFVLLLQLLIGQIKAIMLLSYLLFLLLLTSMGVVYLWTILNRDQRLIQQEQPKNNYAAIRADDLQQKENTSTKYLKSAVHTVRLQALREGLEALPTEYFFDSTLSLAKLAHTLDSSKYEISCLFSTYYGTNFNQYINAIRVVRAKALLVEEAYADVSVKAIGLEVGFSSITSFYRAFKEVEDMPPLEYRKRNT